MKTLPDILSTYKSWGKKEDGEYGNVFCYDGTYELCPFFPGDDYGGNLSPHEIENYLINDEIKYYPHVSRPDDIKDIVNNLAQSQHSKTIEMGLSNRFHCNEAKEHLYQVFFDMKGIDYGDYRNIEKFVDFVLEEHYTYDLTTSKRNIKHEIYVLASGQSYHIVANIFLTRGEWKRMMHRSLYAPMGRVEVDSRWVGRSLEKGYSILRMTANNKSCYHFTPYLVHTLNEQEEPEKKYDDFPF